MQTDTILVHHLLSAHPGAHYPWFANGFLEVMPDDALERLHLELVRQGEDCSVVLSENRTDWGARLRRADAGAA
jgi:hypothetical protein